MTRRHLFRLGWHFGLFQALMPIVGWLAGLTVQKWIAAFDHWIAFGLLGFVGLRMLLSAGRTEESGPTADPTRGWSLVTLSVATSIDALAVGLSMALLGVSIWMPSIVIGLVAAGMSLVGICLGSRLGGATRHWAERIGGLVLIAIGLRIVVAHVSGAG